MNRGPSPTFGDLLRRYRTVAGLTQEELAERSGVSPRSIGDIERGVSRAPHKQTVGLVADALDLASDERAAFISAARRPSSIAPGRSPLHLPTPLASRPALRAPASVSHPDLPLPLTSFVGRARELAEVANLLPTARLVTLTGTGGCGKTRLALEFARTNAAKPVALVELAALSDPSHLAHTIATRLDVRQLPGDDIVSSLVVALREEELVLVLDNCEHLLDACAPLVKTLLESCPRLWVLATSWEPLGIPGEISWRVPSLAAPSPHARPGHSAQDLARYDAIQLFVERARTARPGFLLTDENAPLVEQICRGLDGIPLALELAAARLRLLTLAQISTGLNERFVVLTNGDRTVPSRHRTLWALIDWSYDLLGEEERILFRRLSVFAGSFDLDGVAGVAGPAANPSPGASHHLAPNLLDLLGRLVDKSLVVVETAEGDRAGYRLLETLRQYGWERLVEAGELGEIRGRHAAHFQALAEKAISEIHSPQRKAGLDRLEREHDNLRAALRFLIDRHDAEQAVRFCETIVNLWLVRGYVSEGRAWLAEIFELAKEFGRAADYARLLRHDGTLAFKQNDWADTWTQLNQSLAIWRQLGDREGMADELGALGLVVRARGDYAAARPLFEESLRLYRDLGREEDAGKQLDRLGVIAFYQGDDATARAFLDESLTIRRRLKDPLWLGWALQVLGMVAHGQGDHAAAQSYLDEALAIWRELEYREGVAMALGSVGDLQLDLGDLIAARSALAESLALWRDFGGYVEIVEHALECLGGLAAARDDAERAIRLWGAAAVLRERIGEPLPPDIKARLKRRMLPIQVSLSADAFAQAWTDGQAMTLEQAITYALEDDA